MGPARDTTSLASQSSAGYLSFLLPETIFLKYPIGADHVPHQRAQVPAEEEEEVAAEEKERYELVECST